jgi:hypothetical protein
MMQARSLALEIHRLLGDASLGIGDMVGDQVMPQMTVICPCAAAESSMPITIRACGPQRIAAGISVFASLVFETIDRAGARILDDVLVIALGIGGVGRHGHAARRHDRQIGDAEFRPVLG